MAAAIGGTIAGTFSGTGNSAAIYASKVLLEIDRGSGTTVVVQWDLNDDGGWFGGD